MAHMEYPEVKKAHIVPRSYLLNFAVDKQLCLSIDGRCLEHPVSIDDAAVRRMFYRRYRKDGTPIDDVEWSLAKLEGVIAPILRDLHADWPPPLETVKAPLAEFFAFQFIRGPRWKRWYEQKADERIAKLRKNPEPVLNNGIWLPITQKQINEFEDHVLSETTRLTRMMLVSNLLVAVFGAMTWHLVEFEEPLLAISDHPVVSWSSSGTRRDPEPNDEDLGALNFLEVRVPISPSLALLMSWAPPPDAPEILLGTKEIAANLNAFTIANAERQWMSMPGTDVPIADGGLEPVVPLLVHGYSAAEAEASELRKRVSEAVQPKLGSELHEVVDEGGHMTVEIITAQEA